MQADSFGKRATFVLLGAMAAVTVSTAKAANMLADPGFEVSQGAADASGGDVYGATGWTVFGGGTYTTATVAAPGGTQSFKSFSQYNGGYQQFAVTPGETLTGSASAVNSSTDPLGAGTEGDMELDFFSDATGDNPTYNVFPIVTGASPSNTWETVTDTVTAPANANFVRFQLIQTAYAGGAVFYDNTSLTQPAAVPEPASVGLIATALAAAGASRRRGR